MALWEQITSLYGYIDGILNAFLIAVVIFVIGLIIGKLLGSFLKKILHELELNNIIKSATGKSFALEENIGDFVSYIVYFLAAIMALERLGLTTTILNMIAGAVIVIIIVAFILGIKDYVPNAIAGILIYKNKPFVKGSIIEVAGVRGTVKSIDLTQTEIESKGDTIFIPNATIQRERVSVKKS